jgi:hypothetical protein
MRANPALFLLGLGAVTTLIMVSAFIFSTVAPIPVE